jgi:hypothetical protein
VSTAKDVNDFLPKETIPNSINLPASFNAKGTFKGTITFPLIWFWKVVLVLQNEGLIWSKNKNKEKYNVKTDSTILIWKTHQK